MGKRFSQLWQQENPEFVVVNGLRESATSRDFPHLLFSLACFFAVACMTFMTRCKTELHQVLIKPLPDRTQEH
jgi:hypothetical protein